MFLWIFILLAKKSLASLPKKHGYKIVCSYFFKFALINQDKIGNTMTRLHHKLFATFKNVAKTQIEIHFDTI